MQASSNIGAFWNSPTRRHHRLTDAAAVACTVNWIGCVGVGSAGACARLASVGRGTLMYASAAMKLYRVCTNGTRPSRPTPLAVTVLVRFVVNIAVV